MRALFLLLCITFGCVHAAPNAPGDLVAGLDDNAGFGSVITQLDNWISEFQDDESSLPATDAQPDFWAPIESTSYNINGQTGRRIFTPPVEKLSMFIDKKLHLHPLHWAMKDNMKFTFTQNGGKMTVTESGIEGHIILNSSNQLFIEAMFGYYVYFVHRNRLLQVYSSKILYIWSPGYIIYSKSRIDYSYGAELQYVLSFKSDLTLIQSFGGVVGVVAVHWK